MIKVEKDLKDLPNSLKFTEGKLKKVPYNVNKTTYQYWQDIIALKRYPKSTKGDASNFIDNCNNRYKHKDIKTKLENIYNHKCAFCEQKVEILAVEHFRPKDTYYWLCYSWDNLLYACVGCNSPKLNNFDISDIGTQATYNVNVINNIHNLAEEYEVSEQPKLIHPEREDAEPLLIFDTNGNIRSNDNRMKYTISTCSLDRTILCDFRKEIYDDIESKTKSLLLQYKVTGKKKFLYQLQALKQNFKNDCIKTNDANNPKPFLAFRRFIVTQVWV